MLCRQQHFTTMPVPKFSSSPLVLYTRLLGSASAANEKVADEESALTMVTDPPRASYSDLPRLDDDDDDRTMGRKFSDSWEIYNTLLEKRPLLIKSTTAFFILSGGDLAGQCLEHVRGKTSYDGVDWPRAARFAAFGVLGAPWSHYYFHFLDYYFPPTPEPFTKTTAVKLFIDQAIQAPFLLALIVCFLEIMKGNGIAGAKAQMKDSYVDTLILNCK
jgi:hypothetical protein